jgi:hypothetical protein
MYHSNFSRNFHASSNFPTYSCRGVGRPPLQGLAGQITGAGIFPAIAPPRSAFRGGGRSSLTKIFRQIIFYNQPDPTRKFFQDPPTPLWKNLKSPMIPGLQVRKTRVSFTCPYLHQWPTQFRDLFKLCLRFTPQRKTPHPARIPQISRIPKTLAQSRVVFAHNSGNACREWQSGLVYGPDLWPSTRPSRRPPGSRKNPDPTQNPLPLLFARPKAPIRAWSGAWSFHDVKTIKIHAIRPVQDTHFQV